jgi:hypothetical protein
MPDVVAENARRLGAAAAELSARLGAIGADAPRR